MKQVYLLAALLMLGGSTFGQRASVERVPATLNFATPSEVTQTETQGKPIEVNMQKAAGDTVMYDDFANGLAGNNSFGAWTTGGADGAMWLYDLDGPNGAFSLLPDERIESSTWDNGFMIFDSDSANNIAGGTPMAFDGYLVSPAMDLTATPYVRLTFQTAFRWCCTGGTSHFVGVSTDGGATWTANLPVNESTTNNSSGFTGADQTLVFNLGPYISSDPSNVKFRIVHDGGAGNTHYHWQVDDIALVESPQNDISAASFAFDNYVGAELVENLEFSVYPMNHLREFTMKAVFSNEGAADATDVTFNAEVFDGSMTSIWTGSAVLPTLSSGAVDSLEINGFTPPSVVDDYSVVYSLTSNEGDDLPGDTEGSGSFAVSDYIYAMDDGARDGTTDNLGEAYQIGNLIYIVNDDEITGIRVAIATGSSVGVNITGSLLDGNFDPIDITEEYELSSGDFTTLGGANWIDLPFSSPVAVTAGEEYLIVIDHYGGADNVELASSGTSVDRTTFIFRQELNEWFFQNTTPMVRATFDPTVSIEESDIVDGVGLGQNFPNPLTNGTTIPYSLETAANVTLEVYDVTGKMIRSLEQGRLAPGTYQVNMNSTNLDSGVYYYTLVANNVRVTKKMTILK